MRRLRYVALVLLVSLFVVGCSTKQEELYNKSADFWYEQIIYDIKDSDLEAADKHFVSMSAEHVASPLLPQVMLILAQAHAHEEEYVLANFYLDEYMKRYGDEQISEYARFLKIKANFDSFAYQSRNQQLLLDTIEDTKVFTSTYPNSIYRPLVETILVKMELGEYYMQREIASLYKRTGKPDSAQIYEDRLNESSLKDANMIDPKVPWYRAIFE